MSRYSDFTKFRLLFRLGFLIIYLLEMMFKVVSKGFIINKFSYLRNPWNILDFIVVAFGCVTEVLQV